MSEDTVDRLRALAARKVGDPGHRLRELAALKVGDPIPVSALAGTAANELEEARLQIRLLRRLLGKADLGPSFAEITKDLPHCSTEPASPK